MIQFLGIDFSLDRVCAAVIGRDLSLTCERSTPIAGARPEPSGDGAAVVPAEWTRAGAYVTQEIYLDLPVPLRKVWGIGLAAPSGWIALDPEYQPLSELRLVPPEDIAGDVRRWIDSEPRREKRVAAILSPKDYYRFAISGALAADVTLASRQSLLEEASSFWDREALRRARLDPRWLPPVFDGEVRTGRISQQGVERTGLPGGTWLVAGGLSECCARIVSGDLRSGKLHAPAGAARLAYSAGERADRTPERFRKVRDIYCGHWVLERDVEKRSDFQASTEQAKRDLEAAGFEVQGVIRAAGNAAQGAAALAAVGSGLVRSWDLFYRKTSLLPSE